MVTDDPTERENVMDLIGRADLFEPREEER